MFEPEQRKTTLPTGFGGSYDQYQGDKLSLDKLLVQTPSATYFMRVSGDNAGARIENDDIVIVDKSLKPTNNDIVIAIVNENFVIRRIEFQKDKILLFKRQEQPSEILSPEDVQIWGVVTTSITQHRTFHSQHHVQE
ncbi:MAG: S24 family peptidase [Gammaproteobacteria bacterium]|nr:S24 family peptidase [Gammaproteobacteria bacterium]MDH5630035.1 S24 family peptidase [Gammaproteobacteria bacterium]